MIPLTVLKEAIYSRLLDLPEKEGQSTNLSLDFDVAPLTLKEIFSKYVNKFGMPPGVESVEDLNKLRKIMAIAMRHSNCDEKICYRVAYQSLEKGLPYVLFGASRKARLLNQFAKEVSGEVNSNKSLEFKFHHDSPEVIFTYCNLVHNTADLLLKHYMKTYPDRTVLIYTRRFAFWVKDNIFDSLDLKEFNESNLYSQQLASM